MSGERPKIVLDESDFADAAEDAGGQAVGPPPSAGLRPGAPRPSALASPPSVALPPLDARGALRIGRRDHGGVADSTKLAGAVTRGWLNSPARSLLLAAGIGVLAAWAVTEFAGLAEFTPGSKTAADAHVGVWTGAIGVVFGGTLLCFDSALAGAFDVAARQFVRAVVPMFIAAFVAGFAANAVYLQIVQHVFEAELRGEGIAGQNDVRFYLARALGWALFGAGVGATVGLLKRSARQALNGAIGGVIGGTAGGVVFQFVAANLEAGNSLSRLLGLTAVGALIAIATRAVETARRYAWLQVLAGGMAGKEFIIYHDLTRIGSSPECEIFLLKDPGIAKVHATIEDRGARRTLTVMAPNAVLVNDRPMSSHTLAHGDRLQIGSTLIAYSERAVAGAG